MVSGAGVPPPPPHPPVGLDPQTAIPGLRAGDELFGQLTSKRPKLRRSRVFGRLSALAAVTKQEALLETSRCIAVTVSHSYSYGCGYYGYGYGYGHLGTGTKVQRKRTRLAKKVLQQAPDLFDTRTVGKEEKKAQVL